MAVITRGDLLDTAVDVPVGAQVGVSRLRPADAAAVGWREACTALRFTQPSTRERGPYNLEESFLLRADWVGSYGILAEFLPADVLAMVDDVQALDALVAQFGTPLLQALDAVAATNSVREAGRRLRLHHNSVAARVTAAERTMGFTLSEPFGRSRLFQALTLRRLKESASLFSPSELSHLDGKTIHMASDGDHNVRQRVHSTHSPL
jgi:hypothetical protein